MEPAKGCRICNTTSSGSAGKLPVVSTVMAPSRERVHMLSWVAMERIYEREILPDPKLHKEAVPRPLRADARRLGDRSRRSLARSIPAPLLDPLRRGGN